MTNELEDQVEAYFVALAGRIAPDLGDLDEHEPGGTGPDHDRLHASGPRRAHPIPLAGSGPRRSRRRLVTALAMTAAVVLVIVAVGLTRRGSGHPDPQDVVTTPSGALPFLVPTFLPADWIVSEVLPLPVDPRSTGEVFLTYPELTVHALWTDDPSTTPSNDSRIVQVTSLAEVAMGATRAEPRVEDNPGHSSVGWDEGGLHLMLMARNVPVDQLLALRDQVTVTDETVVATTPDGFRDAIDDPSSVTFPFRSSPGLFSRTESLADATTTGYLTMFERALPTGGFTSGDWGVAVIRAEQDRLWLASISDPYAAITPTEVDGKPGFRATTECDLDRAGCRVDPSVVALFWWIAPDVVVIVRADTEANARAIAASLTEVDATAFDDFRWNVQYPPTPAPGDQPPTAPSDESSSGPSTFETAMLDSTGLPRVDSCGQVVRFTYAEQEAAIAEASGPPPSVPWDEARTRQLMDIQRRIMDEYVAEHGDVVPSGRAAAELNRKIDDALTAAGFDTTPQEPVIGSGADSLEFTNQVFAILKAQFEAKTGCTP